MKVRVETLLVQELEVPEGWDRMDVYDFLGECQSFRSAFQGVGNAEATIVDVMVLEERVTELGEEAYDE